MNGAALSLIRAVVAKGGRISVNGPWLVIDPRKAGEPIADELRRHKAEIIAFLQASMLGDSPPMPAGVRLVRWEPKKPPVQLSQFETVTDSERFICATLRQLDARLQDKAWLTGNWSLAALVDRLEAVGCYVALENPRLALQ